MFIRAGQYLRVHVSPATFASYGMLLAHPKLLLHIGFLEPSHRLDDPRCTHSAMEAIAAN